MTRRAVAARLEPGIAGRVRVLSPLVGYWSSHPDAGALLGPASAIGMIERAGVSHPIILPEGTEGRVVTAPGPDRTIAVEHGSLLFELTPLAREDGVAPARAGVAAASSIGGGLAILAPTDGVFYRSVTPGAAPFISPGARVRSGQPLGLIEVMKTFNQILYGGDGLPDEAEVVSIAVEDRAEVRAGQPLVFVRP